MDDAKAIDLICTESKLISQSEPIKYLRKTRNTNNVAQIRRTNQRRTKTTKSQNKKRNRCENHLFQKKRKREKRVRGVILGQKLTLNHPSLMDEGEETRTFVTTHKREREKRYF